MRKLGLTAARRCGMHRLFQRDSRGPVVLFYHGVEEKLEDPAVQSLHMLLPAFERQMRFLKRHREVISLQDLYEAQGSGRGLDPRQVVLTFDDGYKNNLRVAAPLLHGWKLPFALFVSSRHIEEHLRFATYYVRAAVLYTEQRSIRPASIGQSFDLTSREQRMTAQGVIAAAMKKAPQDVVDRIVAECMELLTPQQWAEINLRFASDEPMSWEEVNRLRALGGTIGAHCHDHCILHSAQPEGLAEHQIRESKRLIEKKVSDCRFLSYPNGTAHDISPAAYSAARAAGFQMAFSTIEGEITPEIDRHIAPRIWAHSDYEEFRYTLSRSGRMNRSYSGACEAVRKTAPARPAAA